VGSGGEAAGAEEGERERAKERGVKGGRYLRRGCRHGSGRSGLAPIGGRGGHSVN